MGVNFEQLCTGAVQNYSFNPADIAGLTDVEAIKQRLIDQLENTVRQLEHNSHRTIANIYIGKTYIPQRKKPGGQGYLTFDPLNKNTWKMEGIGDRWSDHRYEGYGRDGLVVLGAITRETMPERCRGRVHQEDFALAMEQMLLHHYLLSHPDPRVVNETFSTGQATRTKRHAYAVYMAFRYEDTRVEGTTGASASGTSTTGASGTGTTSASGTGTSGTSTTSASGTGTSGTTSASGTGTSTTSASASGTSTTSASASGTGTSTTSASGTGTSGTSTTSASGTGTSTTSASGTGTSTTSASASGTSTTSASASGTGTSTTSASASGTSTTSASASGTGTSTSTTTTTSTSTTSTSASTSGISATGTTGASATSAGVTAAKGKGKGARKKK